jgi:hypothetical protein
VYADRVPHHRHTDGLHPDRDAAAAGTTNRDACATYGPHDNPADADELAALGSADRRPSDPERSVRRLIGVRDPAACRSDATDR